MGGVVHALSGTHGIKCLRSGRCHVDRQREEEKCGWARPRYGPVTTTLRMR